MEKNLYHFTSCMHLAKIMNDRFLKLTPSNLIEPTDARFVKVGNFGYDIVSELSDPVKPVVWLTDSESGEGLGVDDSLFPKNEIKITIPMKPKYKWWVNWAQKNRMNKKWFKRFTQGLRYGSWYVCEEIIPFEDISKIENTITGEVLFLNEYA